MASHAWSTGYHKCRLQRPWTIVRQSAFVVDEGFCCRTGSQWLSTKGTWELQSFILKNVTLYWSSCKFLTFVPKMPLPISKFLAHGTINISNCPFRGFIAVTRCRVGINFVPHTCMFAFKEKLTSCISKTGYKARSWWWKLIQILRHWPILLFATLSSLTSRCT